MVTAMIGFKFQNVHEPVHPLPLKHQPLHMGLSMSGTFWLYRFDNQHGAHVSCKRMDGTYHAVHCVFPGTGPQWHCVHHETHVLTIAGLSDMLDSIKEGTWTPSSTTCGLKT